VSARVQSDLDWPPEELDLVYEGVKRHRPPRRGDLADPGRHAGPVALDAETAKTIFETLRRRDAMSLKLFERGIAVALMILCSCLAHESTAPRSPHQITQVSIINALAAGHYDGVMPIPELLRDGDFGVGTLDHLDGELVVLDGRPYQVRRNGAVVAVPPDRSTPFAVVTRFEPDGAFACPPVSGLANLDARIDEALPQRNHFVAIRVDGRFASLTLRSVGRQEPPYRPLVEVADGQSVWTRDDQVGTLLGIRCPAWVGGLNVPGYHWHFLSDDRKVGGHVLDCRISSGRVRYQVCQDWMVKLDRSDRFDSAELTRDRSREIRRVETARDHDGDQPHLP
jgi:acetolactate decarboxylase